MKGRYVVLTRDSVTKVRVQAAEIVVNPTHQSEVYLEVKDFYVLNIKTHNDKSRSNQSLSKTRCCNIIIRPDTTGCPQKKYPLLKLDLLL